MIYTRHAIAVLIRYYRSAYFADPSSLFVSFKTHRRHVRTCTHVSHGLVRGRLVDRMFYRANAD